MSSRSRIAAASLLALAVVATVRALRRRSDADAVRTRRFTIPLDATREEKARIIAASFGGDLEKHYEEVLRTLE